MDKPHMTAKGMLDKQVRDLATYLTKLAEVTKVEAEHMIMLTLTAIVHKLIETGKVALPTGDLVMSVNPKLDNPLRMKSYMPYELAKLINLKGTSREVVLQEFLLPEHYEILKHLHNDAVIYQRKKQNDAIQKNSNREL